TSAGLALMRNNKKITMKFVDQKTDFVNIETEFYTLHGKQEKKENLITDNVQQSKICSGQSTKVISGLTFCQEVRYVDASSKKDAPFFPLTGPFKYQ
ncbi:hypothetical protein Ahia01_001002300, partial [Argonauta hians]